MYFLCRILLSSRLRVYIYIGLGFDVHVHVLIQAVAGRGSRVAAGVFVMRLDAFDVSGLSCRR